jgi:hypothetical protein
VALAGKRHRSALGRRMGDPSCVVVEMCRAPKCRAADDLLMTCELHLAYAEARAELPYRTTRDLITVATGQRSVQERHWRSGMPSERIEIGRPSSAGGGNLEWCSTSCGKPVGRIRLSRSRRPCTPNRQRGADRRDARFRAASENSRPDLLIGSNFRLKR